MDKRPQSGFTLIELMIAMVVAGILLGVGVPSFMSAMANSRISTENNRIVGSLFLARSEAVKSSISVTVCPRAANNTSCGSDWNKGWIVFRDAVTVTGETSATIENPNSILAVETAISDKNSLSNYGSSDRTASSASGRNYIRYFPTGRTDWLNGSFVLCDDRGEEHSRAINVVLTGDIRPGRTNGTSQIPQDVFSREISC